MINIQPVDFQWPITGTQEALAIQYNADITIGQLQEYLLNDQRLGQIVTVAYDNQCQQVLPPHMSLQQCFIPPDCNLYLFMQAQQGGMQNQGRQQAAAQEIIINLFNGGAFVGNYQLTNDSTVQEVIALLVQNEIIQPNPLSIEVKDLQGNILFTDQSYQFKSKPLPEYNLYVIYAPSQNQSQQNQNGFQNNNQQQYNQQANPPQYNQQGIPPQGNAPQYNQQGNAPQPNQQGNAQQSTIQSIDQIMTQMAVFDNFSIFVDTNGQFIVYKYHKPIIVNGFLKQGNGIKQTNIQRTPNDTTIERFGVTITMFKEYGLLVKWRDNTFNSIRISQKG